MAKNKHFKKLPARNTVNLTLPQPIDYNSCKPIFSFFYMQYQSKQCLSQCDQNSKSDVVNTLLRLSQCTWQEINVAPKQSLGFEPIPVYRFKAPFPPIVTPEVRSLTVFRYSSVGRIAGFREKDIYHILMVGPQLYKH